MVARFVLLSALLVIGVSAGRANTQPPASELSFTVLLRAAATKAAVCVAQTSDLSRARRISGLAESSTGDWSPDGQALAVADGDPPKGGIHVLGADGGGVQMATRPRANELDSAPTWSPDGMQIAFVRYAFFARGGADYGRAGVWVTALDSRAERQLSRRLAGTLDWSPTGDLIAADVGGEFKTDIDLVRPSGGIERTIRVGSAASFDDGTSWSPDGTRLAVGDGLVVDRSGNEVGRYAPAPGRDYVLRLPAWSPDGDSVVYVRALTWVAARTNVRVIGLGDLYLGSVTGRDPVRLTATTGTSESAPAWRPSAPDGAGRNQPCVLRGTARRDVLRGTALDDLIDAGAGNDVVYGAGGNDFAVGGTGGDVLVGGPGRDWLWGEAGNDRFRARDRNRDSILGGLGGDRATVDRRLDTVLGVERVFAR
jgi:RTX calcium-binding nonapeptide repeat (4 copies)/WD40-like Beta Propeller Repeat